MVNIEKFKNEIIDEVKSNFIVNKLEINFKEEFYYPKLIHFLKFNISQYEVEGLGNMAILTGKGCGLMKMITVVITPTVKKDIPFLIIDFIKMANKRTVFVEFYTNHLLDKDNEKKFVNKLEKLSYKYKDIKNYIEEPEWYTPYRNIYSPLKKSSNKEDKLLCEMVLESLNLYLDFADKINNNYIINKQLEDFINNLIYKGTPSAGILEKTLGKDETIRFFKEVVFFYDGR